MTSLVTYNEFLLSKSYTTQIKEILSSQQTEKIAPIECSGQWGIIWAMPENFYMCFLWQRPKDLKIEFKLHQKTEQDKVSQTLCISKVLICRCPSLQCYCYDASEKENSTRKDRRWARPEWGDMTKCGPVTYCTRHGSLSDPQARRLASSPTPHFFIVQTPHCTTHTIWTSREKTISTQPHS